MRKHLVLLLVILITSFSCTDRDDNITKVNLRIKNTSEVTYQEVIVVSDTTKYTNISSGSYSDYLEYDQLYSYAYINIISDGETYVLQPVDFVGESLLAPGFYTYELGLDESGNVLLNFVVD
ncbi:hypothetical protein [uncultured Maribacter sp.]|uniref:hypothetical protein n=1 Tax=uncultured Maribacter sp. TaxID=431308 RepID=UPI00262DC78E|nr:hypothetical protein [uncultured Maribacter sp.]